MAGVARARYTLKVAWNAVPAGIFAIGFSKIGGQDIFGVSPFQETFGGTYDDVSTLLARATFRRGRVSADLATVEAGSGSFTLRDPAGRFNPLNSASPLYGLLDDRLHPTKLEATLSSTTYPLWFGWTRAIYNEPTARKGLATLEAVDLFYWLQRANPIIPSTGPTTTGAAIGKVLDAILWTDPVARDLDVGDPIPDFSADGTKSALDLIGDLLRAERGVFYIAASGKTMYEDRHARLLRTVSQTIANKMSGAGPGVDFDLIRSRARVKRTQSGYTAEVVDETARRKVGYADAEMIETPYLPSNSQADSLAAYVLSQVKQSRPPVYDLEIDNRETALLTAILSGELVDKWTVSEASSGTAGDFHIESMEHALTAQPAYKHSCRYVASRAEPVTPLIIGSGLIGTGQLVY